MPDTLSAMWPHFKNLFARSVQSFLQSEGTTALGWIGDRVVVPVAVFIATLCFIFWREGWAKMKEHWVKSFGKATGVAIGVLVLWHACIFSYSVVKTIYQDHESLAAQVGESDREITSLQKDRDAWKDKYEGKIAEKPKVIVVPKLIPPPPLKEPIIRAFPRELPMKSNRYVTEFTITSDVEISPPLVIEMIFDHPIAVEDVSPLPHGAVAMGGGSRWNGNNAYLTVPLTGIGPDVTWIAVIESLQPVHLVSRPTPRKGF